MTHGTRATYAEGCRCRHCAAATACDPDLQVEVVWDGWDYLLPPEPEAPREPPIAPYTCRSTAPVLAVFQTQGPLTVRDVWRALWPAVPYERRRTPRYRALYHQVDALRRRGKVVRVGRSPQGTQYQRAGSA